MITLQNNKLRMTFDDNGRLAALSDVAGAIPIPIDAGALTDAFAIELREEKGEVTHVSPQAAPTVQRLDTAEGQVLACAWEVSGDWGALSVRSRVVLPPDSPVSLWTMEVDNHTKQAIWQVAYPRVTGLTAFSGYEGPDWIAEPFLMGEKTPDPVAFVNDHENVISTWGRSQFGCFDVEGGRADIAFSYPGMWTLQFLAYGHPAAGGVYFAAHDGQALYKRFGMYADGGDGKHAALALKQYPEDRTLAGGSFKSFFAAAVGVYAGDWWGASEIYRQWGVQQYWCAKGPTRVRSDVPEWVKKLDLWYWNWQFVNRGHPRHVVPIIKYLKERYECEIAFHWYGFTGEFGPTGDWRAPEVYPYDPDVRDTLIQGVKDLHAAGVHCLPYIECRLWNENTRSFRAADGMKWIAVDENGKSADAWGALGHTMCPTAPPFHALIRGITNRMIDDIGMDGAYLDQVSGCYAVPCFNPDHDHGTGGHDHWTRGYRELLEGVQQDIKSRSPDNAITSESCIECYLDLFDDDLTREIANLNGFVGSLRSLPIPMFHSVYHDYHMTYGTTSTFQAARGAGAVVSDGFRLSEALVLVSGCQLMVSGVLAGDERKEGFQPQLDYMEKLTRARKAGRKFFNLGVWKPPLTIECERVDVAYSANRPPKEAIPAVLSGCFELEGELCMALANHTEQPRDAVVDISPKAYGLAGEAFELWSVYPGAETRLGRIGPEGEKRTVALGPASAQVLILRPVA
ncbi:MAG: hypothetical protein HY321_01190 [Armatimonadetes bacterium]|nr:hypothetical protein [Armatimonadota bacterium]